jgi:Flp pilus assembly protein TadG
MMKKPAYHSESGQSLFLVTLLLFVFFGLLALALDIGYGYYQRRVAQNAADAGALAAASVYCNSKDTRDPVATMLAATMSR